MTSVRSRNQLWTGVSRASTAAIARSLNVTGERPGVQDRHFWLPA